MSEVDLEMVCGVRLEVRLEAKLGLHSHFSNRANRTTQPGNRTGPVQVYF